MTLNLIRDPWIPVATASGPRTIRPDQIAEADVLFPAWPRADLNIACLELLIGLVALADPPASREDWRARRVPDPERLRDRLAPFAEAFELGGEGPRFLQDLEPLPGEPASPDMLFIDSAGENAAKKNADLMVWRDRYPALAPALAAMALYTLQAHAPSGGAGNRTSMRGGGPLVTLVEPRADCTLWDLVWANVPFGGPQGAKALPWMRPTRVSDKGQQVHETPDTAIEAFFGMPRRLRLVFGNGLVTGVIQRPWGTNYGLWRHPLTPYYRMKPGEAPLPVHPRAGTFGYRNWLGVVAKAEKAELRERAAALDEYDARALRERDRLAARVIVAGWAMDNMKPLDFTLSVQPFVALPTDPALMLAGLVEAAEQAALALRAALEPVLAGGVAREAAREAFYADTERAFRDRFAELAAEALPAEVAVRWRDDLRKQALARFDALALPGLDQQETDVIERIVAARRRLVAAFSGHGKYGEAMFDKLELERPARKGKAA